MFPFRLRNNSLDPRDEFIGTVARGNLFVDVGGLWGTVNEKVCRLSVWGECCCHDRCLPRGTELWSLFDKRRRALNLPDVQCISGDILTIDKTLPGIQFDVVHCSGVLYHMPDPVFFLATLRKLTKQYLVLTSVTTTVRNENGSYASWTVPCSLLRFRQESVEFSSPTGRGL